MDGLFKNRGDLCMATFSRKTIATTMDILAERTHAHITNFLIRHGLEEIAPQDGSSISVRVNKLTLYLSKIQEENQELVSDVITEVIQEKLNDIADFNDSYSDDLSFESRYESLVLALRKDGFSLTDNKIKRQLPEDIELNKYDNEVTYMLKKHQFDIPLSHLEQAKDAYDRQNWASANSQLRTYVEALCNEMAIKMHPGERLSGNSHSKKAALATTNPPIFIPELNEWLGDGKGFIEGFWKRLHPEGSHPGLSDVEDCTFRLHLVTLVTSQILRRYDKAVS